MRTTGSRHLPRRTIREYRCHPMRMTNRERFRAWLSFKPADRMPVIEPFKWWDLTLKRWRADGLPESTDLAGFFGLDPHHQTWIGPAPDKNPDRSDGLWDVDSFASYERAKRRLYPVQPFDQDLIRSIKPLHDRGDIFAWITVEGFFWFPRELLGIERHFTAFYELPELMHAINRDLLEYNKRVMSEYCSITVPDWMTVAEDMSYNTGCMIGKRHFDEFMRPYYIELVSHARECGISFVFIDTDGNCSEIIPWFHEELGVDGFVPFERNAGMNLNIERARHPRLLVIGGFNKRVMSGADEELIAEFEHALPALKTRGIILGCDHQTPPEVSIEQYRRYVALLSEYALKAAS